MARWSVKDDQYVWARSSLRIDLAGGWSDTPPYTYVHGGKVLNIAVNLNGQQPVQVYIRKNPDPRIRIHSIDLGSVEECSSWEQLESYADPGSSFSLAKAALVSVGLHKEGFAGDLPAFLARMGGGIDLTTFVAVPRGSGLGTSSILAATITAALHRFCGKAYSLPQLTAEVLEIERMIGTGGGWQDQVGGAVGGVKLVTGSAHNPPLLHVEHLDTFMFSDPEMLNLFTVYYTGMTRLAKNILDDVVSRVEKGDKEFLVLHQHIKDLADAMRAAISSRDRNEVARLLMASFEANKRIHPSTVNSEIESLLGRVRPWYDGVKLAGAGGGGYALFLSPDANSAKQLRVALTELSEPHSGRVVALSLGNGLEVTVS